MSTIAELPTLGLGVSLSLQAKPDPVALCRAKGGPQFVEYAGRASWSHSAVDVQRVRDTGVPVLFHPSFLNFCGTFPNDPSWLATTAKHVLECGTPWLAQDVGYCHFGGHPGYSSQFGYFIPPICTEGWLEFASERVREVQAAISVPIAIEPPPFVEYCGDIPLLRFFGELSRQTGCLLLLDAGHLVSYELATGARVAHEWRELPAENIVEVHVAGGELVGQGTAKRYQDAHEKPILEEAWEMFEFVVGGAPSLRAVCVECERAPEAEVLKLLSRAREIATHASPHAALVKKIAEQSREE